METCFPIFPPLDGQPDRFFEPPGVADSATSVLNGNIMAALDDVATIRVSGPDAETFLQGQISNDVRKLSGDRVLLAAYNSPKGRVLAVLFLSRGDNPAEILLETHHAIADGILKRLGAFVLRAQVLLEPSDLRVIGLSGPDAAVIAQKIGLRTPRADDGAIWTNGVQVISRRGETPRFSIRAATARVADLWNELIPHVKIAGSGAWHLLDLLAGLPTVYPSTQDHFIPQMINLDLLGGVSFDKGCYTGQEIVARLHYLGNVKRRMFLIDANADAVDILPGTPIAHGESEETIGEVVDAAPSGAHQCALSAVVKLSHVGSEPLRLRTTGLRLSRAIPFAPGLP